MFAVGNVLDQAVNIQMEMRTNWGIPIFTLPVKLEPHEVRSFNLRDWIVQGSAPGRTLPAAEKAHTESGPDQQEITPRTTFSIRRAVAANLAVGSVVIRTLPNQPPGALWGDFLLVDPALDISMGDDLVNLDGAAGCQGTPLCDRHALRFVSGKALGSGHRGAGLDGGVGPSRRSPLPGKPEGGPWTARGTTRRARP